MSSHNIKKRYIAMREGVKRIVDKELRQEMREHDLAVQEDIDAYVLSFDTTGTKKILGADVALSDLEQYTRTRHSVESAIDATSQGFVSRVRTGIPTLEFANPRNLKGLKLVLSKIIDKMQTKSEGTLEIGNRSRSIFERLEIETTQDLEPDYFWLRVWYKLCNTDTTTTVVRKERHEKVRFRCTLPLEGEVRIDLFDRRYSVWAEEFFLEYAELKTIEARQKRLKENDKLRRLGKDLLPAIEDYKLVVFTHFKD